jgi:predicted hydrolase (HD superfamily)
MTTVTPTRDEAYKLLIKYNQSDSLIKHALTVEGVMVHFAELFNEDPEKWAIIGLIHDLDYEMFPEQHCGKLRKFYGQTIGRKITYEPFSVMVGRFVPM